MSKEMKKKPKRGMKYGTTKNTTTRIHRKMVSVFTATLMVLSVVCPVIPAGAEGNPWEAENYQGGFRPLTGERAEIEVPFLSNNPDEMGEGEIPASYDAREHGQLTSVKDQGDTGTCWAFSMMASLESDLLSRGIASDADLSELHLVRYCFNSVMDPFGGRNGDGTVFSGNADARMLFGGNPEIDYHTLTSLIGAVDESYAPFPADGKDDGFTPSTEDAFFHDTVHLRNFYILNLEDTETVKRAIMERGALAAAFYWGSYYFNKDSNAYYTGLTGTGQNHAICIVGWDDNFSRSNFLTDPGVDGAWLIKNSWGESWGDGGYFWISYGEQTMFNHVFESEAALANEYDFSYEYDGSLGDRRVYGNNELMIANVFTVQGGEVAEEIKAVSVDLASSEVSYEVQVYGYLSDPSDPLSGTPMLEKPVTGTTGAMGYYTIDLPGDVQLQKGCVYSTVITLRKQDSFIHALAEMTDSWGDEMQFIASASDNQSFTSRDGGKNWTDYGNAYNSNLRIKAFSKEIDEIKFNNPFSDVPSEGNWKFKFAKYVYDMGIMNGKGESIPGKVIFSPDQSISRAEFVRVLYNREGTPAVEYSPKYTDVKEGQWYTSAVLWASDNGIVAGKGNNRFDVSGSATREELAIMFYHYAQYKGYDVSIAGGGPDISSFTDADKVSSWAENSLNWALSRGIMAGKGNKLDPKGVATRAECAALIYNFISAYVE